MMMTGYVKDKVNGGQGWKHMQNLVCFYCRKNSL